MGIRGPLPEVDVRGVMKLFDTLHYAEDFLDGSLYMNTLDYFRRLEGDVHRGDKYEGIVSLHQGTDIGEMKFGEVAIDPKEIVNVTLRSAASATWNLFCMYALRFDASTLTGVNNLEEAHQRILFPERLLGLGKHLVTIHDGDIFLSRIRAAARDSGFSLRGGLVLYYDETLSHDFELHECAFRKRRIFGEQREFRIVLDRGSEAVGPYVLEIGSIRDIATLTTPELFNRNLALKLPDGSQVGPKQ